MKLSEAAFIFNISEKTLRRAIAAGRLPATQNRHGVYDVTPQDIQATFGVEARKIQLDAPEPYQDALESLTARVKALEAVIMRPVIYEDKSNDSIQRERKPYVPPPEGHVTRQRAAELAVAHGVGGNGPLKSWTWSAAERTDEETVMRHIQRMARSRFTKCKDLYCPCQEL